MRRFVVGTGRCGSTLLSRMLAQHPGVLGLFEFFNGLDWGRRFASGEVSGREFWSIVAQPNEVTDQALARGYDSDEIAYPFRPESRFKRGDAIPWILIATLPRLTDEHDALFDELSREVAAWPPASLASHYERLFATLGARFGRPLWIERAGSSIDYLGELHGLYPDARFVHIHRDGREAALSIRAHPFFRLAVNAMFGLVPEAKEGEDVVSLMLESEPPVEIYGRFWSDQLCRGFRAAARMEPSQYLEVRFEDLVTRPTEVMPAIERFFALPEAGDWIARAAALVRGVPPTRFDSLAPDDQAILTNAVRPGQILLGRA
jgi:Sulfotransferase family